MKQIFKIKLVVFASVMLPLIIMNSVFGQNDTLYKKAPTPPVDLYFWEYLPPDYSSNTPGGYPLIIFLHGFGQRAVSGNDPITELNKVLTEGLPQRLKERMDLGKGMCFRVQGVEKCFIVLSPQLKDNAEFWTLHPSEFIQYALSNLNVDPNRIYVTGLSMGGVGTLRLAQGSWLHSSDAAAVAVAPGGSANISTACLFAERDIPLWAVHGELDMTAGTKYPDMVNLVNAINNCTNPAPTPLAHLTTIEGSSAHDVWSNFYKTDHTSYFPNVYEWFLLNPKGASNTHPLVPGVYAGINQNISTNSVNLTGTAGDNGGGTINSYLWTKQSGPSSFNIQNSTAASTAVNNLVTGTYVFRLTVTDNNNNTQYDQVTVTVSSTNSPPVANAGTDKNITLPTNSVTLTGSGTDSDGTITGYQWSKISGPSSSNIVTPTSASTSVNNLVQGIYVFQLTVTDDDNATDTDNVQVTVNSSSGSGQLTWHSYNITMQSNPSQQGVINSSDLSTTATVEFYQSTNDFGVDKLSLFTTYTNANHANPDSHATNYWANSSGHAYPFAGISTVGRGSDTGEANAPSPADVYDLQLHPPNTDKLTVAAFIIPVTGNYTVSGLAARRVSANAGTARFKVFDQNKVLKANIQVTNDQDWVVQACPISLGTLNVGDRIYFATDREGIFNSDFTEVTWTVTLSGGGGGEARMASVNNNESKGKSHTDSDETIQISEVNESREISFGLYPNPVENELHFEGVGNEADVKIYDSQRNLIFENRLMSSNGTYDLRTVNLKPGIYYLVLQSDYHLYRFRFIKE